MTTPAPPTISRRSWLALAVLVGTFGLVSISLSVMNVAFDALAEEFSDTSTATLGWVITGYTTMTAALLIAAGRLADRYGRKRVFVIGLVTYVATSVLGGAAWGPIAVIVARAGQGVGAALVTPTSLALLLIIFPAERRSTVIGIWGSVGAVAAAGGPALGGLVVDHLGWRWVFWLNLPLCLLAWWAATAWIDESRGESEGTPDPVGIALSAGAVGFLALGLAQSGDWGWTDPKTMGSLVAGPLLGLALVNRSRSHRSPVIDLGLFRHRSFTVSNLVTLTFNLAFSAMILNNVLFLIRVWGYTAAGAGFGITPSPLSAAIVAQFAGRAADRVGTRRLIMPGIVMFGAGLCSLILWMGTEPTYWTRWFPTAVCFGSGVGMVFTNLSSAAVSDIPASRLAVASATNNAFRAIGAALGPAIVIGTIGAATGVAATERFDSVWVLAAVVAAISFTLASRLPGPPVAPDDSTPAG
ncbi:MAG: MFS transporter [Actinomycetota bacterium]|nr:MFS transporter [Actinomycetota bacterium]